MIIGSLPWAAWLRKKLEAWAEGDTCRKIIAAPEKGNAMVPPCQAEPTTCISANRKNIVAAVNTVSDLAIFAVFILSCMSVVSSGYNPFIYFQF